MAQIPVEDTRSFVVIPVASDGTVRATISRNDSKYEPFVPLGDRVLIRRVEDETDKPKLGMPDKFRQQTNKGEIVAVGGLVTNLKPGDRVLFGEYSAERFMKDGEELWLVPIADIRGVERLK